MVATLRHAIFTPIPSGTGPQVKRMLERRRYARRVTDKKCNKSLGDAAKMRGMSPVYKNDAALRVV